MRPYGALNILSIESTAKPAMRSPKKKVRALSQHFAPSSPAWRAGAVSEDMIERVARAIGQCLHDCGKFKNLPGDPWTDGPSLLAARAAVKAMRVPTLEMLQDGRRSEEHPSELQS